MKTKTTMQTTEDILEELRALVTEAEGIVGNTVSETSEDIISSLRARYEAAQEKLLDAYASARRKAVSGAATVDLTIRERPYQSLAVAAGAGLLIGLLVAMNRNRCAA